MARQLYPESQDPFYLHLYQIRIPLEKKVYLDSTKVTYNMILGTLYLILWYSINYFAQSTEMQFYDKSLEC